MKLTSLPYKRSILVAIFTICTLCLALFIFISISVSAKNQTKCVAYLVETIPEDMTYDQVIISGDTHVELLRLINSAQSSIDIASYYWSLQGKDVMPDPVPEANKGQDVLNALLNAGKLRSVTIRIAVNDDAQSANNSDLNALSSVAQIKRVNFSRLLGAGILHTKFILVDNESFYLGSTNMDWRALTHVKELGLQTMNCPSIAKDLANIFAIYWYLGDLEATAPAKWPAQFDVDHNLTQPQVTSINDEAHQVFFSSSPPDLCPRGRTDELTAVLHAINTAEEYIYIAVMNYFPMFLYQSPNEYWPLIDDALRKAAIERGVRVRLMASKWANTRASMSLFLKSLSALDDPSILKGSIKARFFVVPQFNASQPVIPFTRVNHNKYMITDNMMYISTNNWSGDYFISTGGASILVMNAFDGLMANSSKLHQQLKDIFERDWNSKYCHAP